MKKLTPKQQRFVEEYLIDLNATQAAIRAGYSKKTAEVQGPRLLGNVRVQEAVKKAIDERSEESGVTVERIWKGLLTEAERQGDGSSHSARVSAWAHLAKYKGMFVDKQEIEGGIEIRVVRQDADETD